MKKRSMICGIMLFLVILSSATLARAQGDPEDIVPILSQSIQSTQIVTFQLQQFLLQKAPKLPSPQSAAQWTAESQQIREDLLNDVIFHGWPKDWSTRHLSSRTWAAFLQARDIRYIKFGMKLCPASMLPRCCMSPNTSPGENQQY